MQTGQGGTAQNTTVRDLRGLLGDPLEIRDTHHNVYMCAHDQESILHMGVVYLSAISIITGIKDNITEIIQSASFAMNNISCEVGSFLDTSVAGS